MKKVAINGFGRIGRAALKIILDTPNFQIVALNDLMSVENAAYLLKFDTVYGVYEKEVKVDGNAIVVGGQSISFLNEKDPARLPWKDLGVDIVVESTGFFTNQEDAEKHIHAGAKTVVLSGPSKSKDTPTVVHGVNTADGKTAVFSCASCTTNNIAPVVEILDRRLGIKKAILSTIHAYTASQALVDAPSKKDFRMGRSGAVNLVPSSTGAAIATAKALPQMEGKFDGISIRTPVPVGSISDITLIASKHVTPDEINQILREESQTPRYKNVLSVSDDPLVSSDIIKTSFAAVVDAKLTRVVDGDLVKIMAWYDNEWGFTNQMVRQMQEI